MLKLFLFSSFLFFLFSLKGQTFELLSDKEGVINLSHRLHLKTASFVVVQDENYLDFSPVYEFTTLHEGAPTLPKMSVLVELMSSGSPVLEVQYDSYTELTDVEVAPSKGNLKRNIDPRNIPYIFGAEYQEDAFYPGNLAEISKPFIARDIRGASLTVFPYQYNPVTKVLRIYENITVRIIHDQSENGINELISLPTTFKTNRFYRSLFLNGQGIEKEGTVEESGDLLIICPPEMDSIMQVFANWKNQKGIYTKVVNTNATGIGGNNVKNYVDNYYHINGDFLYLILVGDHLDVPAHTYGTKDGEELWSDSYYGQIAGNDFYPELLVGRFSGDLEEVKIMVERTIEYEENPSAGNWMQKALGLASTDGAGFGLNNMTDWEHMRTMRTDLLTAGYQEVYEFYDGYQGGIDAIGDPTASMISNAINDGIGLMNYAGHGDVNIFNTAGFSSMNIDNLNNHGKYPWVISLACDHGKFTYETCISEKWLRASKNGSATGALAACGSSILMSWVQPMKTQLEITKFISNSDTSNQKNTLGGIFYNAQMKMLEQFPDADGEEVMQTWILFGDPTVEFRSKQVLNLTVSHPVFMEQNDDLLTVSCNVENTLIAVSQEGVLLGKGFVQGGVATISLPTLTTNSPLWVTATKQNHHAYQGLIQVGEGLLGEKNISDAEFSIYPNPAQNQVSIALPTSTESTILLINSLGQILRKIQTEVGANLEIMSLEGVAKGVYQLVVCNSKINTVKKLIVE